MNECNILISCLSQQSQQPNDNETKKSQYQLKQHPTQARKHLQHIISTSMNFEQQLHLQPNHLQDVHTTIHHHPQSPQQTAPFLPALASVCSHSSSSFSHPAAVWAVVTYVQWYEFPRLRVLCYSGLCIIYLLASSSCFPPVFCLSI